jgi:hypothetical protein
MNSLPLGTPMIGGTVAQVIESQAEGYSAGDIVQCSIGWQAYGVVGTKGIRKVDPSVAPITTALGVLGMPGITAYGGLLDIGRAKAGETVVVSAASGAVGSVVGQIAKIKGCRAVGVAGSPMKCAYVVEELGFDACVSHRDPNLAGALKQACPQGIDVYFDNVAGAVLVAVLPQLNLHGRVALCGMISQYNATEPPPGPNLGPLLGMRASIQGFMAGDFAPLQPAFLADCGQWLREGKLRYKEDIVEGLAAAPSAFLRLFTGDNFGKLLVKVA